MVIRRGRQWLCSSRPAPLHAKNRCGLDKKRWGHHLDFGHLLLHLFFGALFWCPASLCVHLLFYFKNIELLLPTTRGTHAPTPWSIHFAIFPHIYSTVPSLKKLQVPSNSSSPSWLTCHLFWISWLAGKWASCSTFSQMVAIIGSGGRGVPVARRELILRWKGQCGQDQHDAGNEASPSQGSLQKNPSRYL